MRLTTLAAMLAGPVWLAAPAAQAPAKAGAPRISAARAAELFTTNCQVCHGPSGTGTPIIKGSAFAGRQWKHGTTPAAVANTIANGVPGTVMLPFKDRLQPDEITALAALVRSFDKHLKPAGKRK
jgi:mono/diheme cytochrome c family protein